MDSQHRVNLGKLETIRFNVMVVGESGIGDNLDSYIKGITSIRLHRWAII